MADESFPPGTSSAPTGRRSPAPAGAGAAPGAPAGYSESWEAVRWYAELCTTGRAEGVRLAAEAFAHGLQEVRAPRGGRSGGPRLPWFPLLLTAVRETAASWEEQGRGDRLNPELRAWLTADRAARGSGARRREPLALRALRGMPEEEGALLWAVEVEAQPIEVTGRQLGMVNASAAAEVARIREVFRERCLHAHTESLADAGCRGYVGLLDAATRSRHATVPDDLRRHLAECLECGEAASCLSLHGGGLAGALAGGVIGWSGLVYLEKRRADAAGQGGGKRRAKAAALSASVLGAEGARERGTRHAGPGGARARTAGVLLGFAVVCVAALVALAVTPSDGHEDTAAARDPGSRTASPPAPGPAVSPSASPSRSSSSPSPSRPMDMEGAAAESSLTPAPPRPTASRTPDRSGSGAVKPKPPAGSRPPAPRPYCTVHFRVVNDWGDGFQGSVEVTARDPLHQWWLGWRFTGRQHVDQMWNGTYLQRGTTVAVGPESYNSRVPAGQRIDIGFLASGHSGRPTATAFTLNGHHCRS
ncbi:hypothetical protein GCM10027168_06550 [Streptomyces capparidis]